MYIFFKGFVDKEKPDIVIIVRKTKFKTIH